MYGRMVRRAVDRGRAIDIVGPGVGDVREQAADALAVARAPAVTLMPGWLTSDEAEGRQDVALEPLSFGDGSVWTTDWHGPAEVGGRRRLAAVWGRDPS